MAAEEDDEPESDDDDDGADADAQASHTLHVRKGAPPLCEEERPRPPGEEALYKYPTRRVGYHPARGLWWCGNPHNCLVMLSDAVSCNVQGV